MVYEVEEPDVKDPNYDEVAQVRCTCVHERSPTPTYTIEPLHAPLFSCTPVSHVVTTKTTVS